MRSHLSIVAACVVFAVGCSAGDAGGPLTQKGSGNTSGSGSGSDNGGSTSTGGSTGTGGSSDNGNGATTPPSSGGTTTTPPTGTTPSNTISKDETWAAGKQIAGSVLIAPGVTVTIAP